MQPEPQPASSLGRHRLTLPTDRSQYDREQARAPEVAASFLGCKPEDVMSATPSRDSTGRRVFAWKGVRSMQ